MPCLGTDLRYPNIYALSRNAERVSTREMKSFIKIWCVFGIILI